jgi:hypothetical protein
MPIFISTPEKSCARVELQKIRPSSDRRSALPDFFDAAEFFQIVDDLHDRGSADACLAADLRFRHLVFRKKKIINDFAVHAFDIGSNIGQNQSPVN